jgi:hypothetical protein
VVKTGDANLWAGWSDPPLRGSRRGRGCSSASRSHVASAASGTRRPARSTRRTPPGCPQPGCSGSCSPDLGRSGGVSSVTVGLSSVGPPPTLMMIELLASATYVTPSFASPEMTVLPPRDFGVEAARTLDIAGADEVGRDHLLIDGAHADVGSFHRSDLNAARISLLKSSGSSHAAKWPPVSTSLK